MASGGTAAQRWQNALADWAIPNAILNSAPRQPFVFMPEMFAAPAPHGASEPSLSDRRAMEALGIGGSVLDVGCGGGVAAFALAPPAALLIGVDRQADMLDLFAATARQRGVAFETHGGSWPEAAAGVPVADVVVCHNVVYNIAELAPFVAALNVHARRRVVIEMTPEHPQNRRRSLWRHFWNLERPREPTSASAAEVVEEAGFDPVVEESHLPAGRLAPQRADLEAAWWCQQLCLPAGRVREVADMMAVAPSPRERITIWWDVGGTTG